MTAQKTDLEREIDKLHSNGYTDKQIETLKECIKKEYALKWSEEAVKWFCIAIITLFLIFAIKFIWGIK